MLFGQKWLHLVFILSFALVVQVLTGFNPAIGKEMQTSQIASYEDPQPDEFMTRWLILAPISISEGEEKPDEEAQKEAFKTDFLIEQGGESGIRSAPWLHRWGRARSVHGYRRRVLVLR